MSEEGKINISATCQYCGLKSRMTALVGNKIVAICPRCEKKFKVSKVEVCRKYKHDCFCCIYGVVRDFEWVSDDGESHEEEGFIGKY